MKDNFPWKDYLKRKATGCSGHVLNLIFENAQNHLDELVFFLTLPFTNQIIRRIHSHVFYFRSLFRMMDNPRKRGDRHETRN